ncbi:hypothetical protein [Poriferisphaera sp. WC338]|uniref:hypothetical protein n=1 Tax=Poriferisphaera sp. WC338 TaxID=3425129 RepID=UPI003D814D28
MRLVHEKEVSVLAKIMSNDGAGCGVSVMLEDQVEQQACGTAEEGQDCFGHDVDLECGASDGVREVLRLVDELGEICQELSDVVEPQDWGDGFGPPRRGA